MLIAIRPAASLPLIETVPLEPRAAPPRLMPGVEPLVTICPPTVSVLVEDKERALKVPLMDRLPSTSRLLLTVSSWLMVTAPCSLVTPATIKSLRRFSVDKVTSPLTFSWARLTLPACNCVKLAFVAVSLLFISKSPLKVVGPATDSLPLNWASGDTVSSAPELPTGLRLTPSWFKVAVLMVTWPLLAKSSALFCFLSTRPIIMALTANIAITAPMPIKVALWLGLKLRRRGGLVWAVCWAFGRGAEDGAAPSVRGFRVSGAGAWDGLSIFFLFYFLSYLYK